MEFKGTKGKWRKFQLPNGNMKITCDDWREFAEIEFKHWQNTEERRKQCLYNALLISKAPEMLEALKTVISLRDLIDYDESIVNESNIGEASALNQMLKRIDSLIKEATEL